MIYATEVCRYARPLHAAPCREWRFAIPGQPLPKGRPRVNTRTGRAYTPPRTRDWERTVARYARAALGEHEPLGGDVALVLRFRRQTQRRADVDNLVKAALDGLNGIAYRDDKQIVRVEAAIEYGCAEPGVDVTVIAA
jgi:crossover junction endodeoxyribonuclease RusA